MEALSLMLYNLCFEQLLEGGGEGLGTFAYCLKLAGEEFKSPKMMLPPISTTADCCLHTQAAFAEAP